MVYLEYDCLLFLKFSISLCVLIINNLLEIKYKKYFLPFNTESLHSDN